MFQSNHVAVACGGNEDVAFLDGLLHRRDLEAFHGGLQGANGVDFGDDNTGTVALHRVRASLADFAITTNHNDLTSNHHVSGALDAVGQGFAATVEVVELRLGHRVVHIDGGHQ